MLSDMAVAAGFFPHAGGAAQLGKGGFEVLSEEGNALALGAQGEQLLLEVEVEREGACQIERQHRLIRGGEILHSAGKREDFTMQLNGTLGLSPGGSVRFIVQEEKFSAEK